MKKEWELISGSNYFSSAQPDSNPFEFGMYGNYTSFPYKLSRMKKNTTEGQYEVLKHTPYGNELVADFAKSAIENEELGADENTDYLCITFTAFNKIIKNYGSDSQEAADAIVRLDMDIQHILYVLNESFGKENIKIYEVFFSC